MRNPSRCDRQRGSQPDPILLPTVTIGACRTQMAEAVSALIADPGPWADTIDALRQRALALCGFVWLASPDTTLEITDMALVRSILAIQAELLPVVDELLIEAMSRDMERHQR